MKSFIYRYLLLSLLSFLFLLAASAAVAMEFSAKTSAKQSSCKLDVGWTEWKPYQYLSAEGKVVGLQIDLLNLIRKEMNCEFVYHHKSWINSVKAVKNGQLDFIGNATINQDRKAFAYFSASYRQDLVVLYIRSKEKERYGLSTLKDLMINHQVKIAMVKNAVYDQQVTALQNDPKTKNLFVYVETSEELLPLLLTKTIDGYFEDPLIFDYSLKGAYFDAEVESYPLVIKMGSIHFMFSKRKTDKETVKRFNQALLKIKEKYSKQFDWFVQQ